MRTAAVRTLAPHCEHKLFLTATPHNGYRESFSALLELLDNQRFQRGIMPDHQQLGAVLVRRMKSELKLWDGVTPRFPLRQPVALEVNYTPEERQAHAWLQEYTHLRQQGQADAVERYATEFVLKLLKKRLFSSPAAFAATLAQHERSLASARGRWKVSRWIQGCNSPNARLSLREFYTAAVCRAAETSQLSVKHPELVEGCGRLQTSSRIQVSEQRFLRLLRSGAFPESSLTW